MEKSWINAMLFSLLLWISVGVVRSSAEDLKENWKFTNGKVLELNDSNIESAISSIDYIFVDFYAPWCGHCKRLSPELDEAALLLSEMKEPIVIAKVNVDKYRHLADKYDVDGFPTLKLFIHGDPIEYYGPRKATELVNYLRKFSAPDVKMLSSDAEVGDYLQSSGSFFPIYIGFGLSESVIMNLAVKYKQKAWFAICDTVSEDTMSLYDFDKTPALLSFLPAYDEKHIFYGPFEEKFKEDFIKQSFLPLAVPINKDTLKLLKDDDRKIVLSILQNDADDSSKRLIKILKSAASANRDLVFGYVGFNQWTEFAETFGVTKKSKFPSIIIWNGDEEYHQVIGSESIDGEDEGSQISRFLEGYREGRTIAKKVEGPSLMGYLNSVIGLNSVYIILFIVAIIMVLQFFSKEQPLVVGTSPSQAATREEITDLREGDKED